MSALLFAPTFVGLFDDHHIGDHVVQTDHQAAHKAGKGVEGWQAMAGHVGSYTACQAVAVGGLALIGVPFHPLGVALALLFSAGTHAFIDRRWPVQWLLRRTGSSDFASLAGHGLNGPYLADQSLHIGCLYVAALIAAAI